jgi:hypothetical protein
MFEALKGGTRSNWKGATRIRRSARLDSLSGPAPFHVAANSGFRGHVKAFGPRKIRAFAIFSAVPSDRWMAVTNPKQQRASREPLIWGAIGRSGDRRCVMRFEHRLLDVQGESSGEESVAVLARFDAN